MNFKNYFSDLLKIMEQKEFVSFKKIIIFGSPGSGKSSLTYLFENKKFEEQSPSDSCM